MQDRTTRPAPLPASLVWLRERLLPRGEGALMFAAYAMLLAALITFVLFQRDVEPARFYLGVLGLAAMFVLHVVLLDLEERLGREPAGWLHLIANGALWLTVTWVSVGSENFSFAPFLLFMLVAEAVVNLPPKTATGYSAALIAGFCLALWAEGFTLGAILTNLLSMSTGLIFVVVFSTVLNLYRQQTQRAEALLAQLTAANHALEQARLRERELAVAEERVRLARDIHDGLGHHLTALNVQLQAAARLVERDPARATAAIASSREVAQAALDEVRQSVAAMRRTPLDGYTLPEALSALAADFGRRAGLAASVTVGGEPADLAPAAAQTLYRAAQEGLTNAHRHGGAQQVWIALDYAAAHVALTVADDGAGTGAGPGGGFGLAGLRERAELLGGRLNAGPGDSRGYTLRIEIPTSSPEVRR